MFKVMFNFKVRKEVKVLKTIKELHQQDELKVIAAYWMDGVIGCPGFRSSILAAICRFALK
jgi:hypothetical protein